MKWVLTTLFDLAAWVDHPVLWFAFREAQLATLRELDPKRANLALQRLDVGCE